MLSLPIFDVHVHGSAAVLAGHSAGLHFLFTELV